MGSHCHNWTDYNVACVASVSVGFQSRERFDNFAAQEMGTSEKMERGGRGEGNERNACQQRSVFCKMPPSSFCRDLSTCRASMTSTS